MASAKQAEKKRIANNEKCANAILEWVIKNNLSSGMMSIYFNNKCYRFTNDNTYQTMQDIKGSKFFEYANDETVSMSFEGTFYHIMNYTGEYSGKEKDKLIEEFNDIIGKFGFYYELGYAWSLSLYEN